MISYKEALSLLHAQGKLASLTHPTNDACGYVSAQDVLSEVSVPSFPNSAMDGFAVRRAEVTGASETNPVTLQVTGSAVAGDAPTSAGGGAWEIMTGAPVPEGYDTVVKIEDVVISKKNTQGRPQAISLTTPLADKANIRQAGEDFVPGTSLLNRGALITPFHVMALAAVGQKTIAVAPKPNITVFSTGKEVIDTIDTPLLPGQIRNSNAPYLMAALGALPVQAQYAGVMHDEPAVFEERLQQVLPKTNIVISTGAVSAGRHDFIPDSLRKLGASILFHKVAIRPGKPILYARFPAGTHYFGLPGNPVSASVGLRFFVVPLLRHLQGMAAEVPIAARLVASSSKKAGFRFFRKARVTASTEGQLQVDSLAGQESFKIHPLLRANCWAVFREDKNSVDAGSLVDVYPLTPEQWQIA